MPFIARAGNVSEIQYWWLRRRSTVIIVEVLLRHRMSSEHTIAAAFNVPLTFFQSRRRSLVKQERRRSAASNAQQRPLLRGLLDGLHHNLSARQPLPFRRPQSAESLSPRSLPQEVSPEAMQALQVRFQHLTVL